LTATTIGLRSRPSPVVARLLAYVMWVVAKIDIAIRQYLEAGRKQSKAMKRRMLREPNWEAVSKRLYILASRMAARAPDHLDGSSVADVVQDTLLEFFQSPNALRWQERRSTIEKFLMGVLAHKIVDRQRRAQRLVPLDFGEDRPLEAKLSLPAVALEHLLEQERMAARASLVGDDPALKALIQAAAELDDGCNVNQRLALALRTSPEDIVNRKKRIQRRSREERGSPWPVRD
jgi:DNA-directed RNA polymerase specialized sigma24 family protein